MHVCECTCVLLKSESRALTLALAPNTTGGFLTSAPAVDLDEISPRPGARCMQHSSCINVRLDLSQESAFVPRRMDFPRLLIRPNRDKLPASSGAGSGSEPGKSGKTVSISSPIQN